MANVQDMGNNNNNVEIEDKLKESAKLLKTKKSASVTTVSYKSDNTSDHYHEAAAKFYQDELLKIPETGDTIPTEASVKKQHWKRFLGMGLSLACSAILSLGLTMFRILNQSGYHVVSLGFWTYQGIFLPAAILLIFETFYEKSTPVRVIFPFQDKEKLKTLAALMTRATVGTAAGLFWYGSTALIGAPEASSISMSAPVLTTILAWLMFGESCGIIPFVAVLLNVIGLFVISRPPWLFGGEIDRDVLIGVSLGLGSLVGNAGAVLSLRFLRNAAYSLVGSVFGLVGSIVSLVGMLYVTGRVEIPVSLWDTFLFAVMAGTAFVGQGFFTISLRFEEASVIAILRCADIIFAYIWQFFLLNKKPDLISVGGTAILLSGVLLVGFRKLVLGLKKQDPFRKRFRFLLA